MTVTRWNDRGRWARAVVSAAVIAAVGLFYFWIARAAAESPFYWKYNLGGFYDYLGRAFASGHLYLPVQPSAELLAQANPWDPATVQAPWKIQDMVYFNRRYYLYHGAGPAVMLFTPWRLVSGYDVPENFAAFLFCWGGFIFSCGALRRILRIAGATPSAGMLAVMLLGLGFCQCVPYLLDRVFVYEIAIAGGYFCVSAAVYCLTRAVQAGYDGWWLAASGLMFGWAISCRPHLGLAGAIAFAGLVLARVRRTRLAAYLAPFCLAGLAVAWYNYARFGNPFEFGIHYLLAGKDQQRIQLSFAYLVPGLYFMLFCAPAFTPVFPWVRQVMRDPFNSPGYNFPPGYFLEPTIGMLYLAPFLVGVVFLLRAPRDKSGLRLLLSILPASSAAILLFVASTGFTSQRYEVDFLPLAVLAALAAIGIQLDRLNGWTRALLAAGLIATVAGGMVAGLALGITGPYDQLLQYRPRTYLRLARWFSPIPRYRPILNPHISVEFTAEFTPHDDGFREPLLTMGQQRYRYFLVAQHAARKIRLVSHTDDSEASGEIDAKPGQAVPIRVTYDSGRLSVAADGREVLVHEIPRLLTAPAQITVGEDRIDPWFEPARFSGKIVELGRSFRF